MNVIELTKKFKYFEMLINSMNGKISLNIEGNRTELKIRIDNFIVSIVSDTQRSKLFELCDLIAKGDIVISVYQELAKTPEKTEKLKDHKSTLLPVKLPSERYKDLEDFLRFVDFGDRTIYDIMQEIKRFDSWLLMNNIRLDNLKLDEIKQYIEEYIELAKKSKYDVNTIYRKRTRLMWLIRYLEYKNKLAKYKDVFYEFETFLFEKGFSANEVVKYKEALKKFLAIYDLSDIRKIQLQGFDKRFKVKLSDSFLRHLIEFLTKQKIDSYDLRKSVMESRKVLEDTFRN